MTTSNAEDAYTALRGAADQVEDAAKVAWRDSDVVAKYAIGRADAARESGDEVGAAFWIDAAFSLNEFQELCWRLDLGLLSEKMRALIAEMRRVDKGSPTGAAPTEGPSPGGLPPEGPTSEGPTPEGSPSDGPPIGQTPPEAEGLSP
jgi:hypothetical protein